MLTSIACMSGTTDLTSMTRSDPVAGWKARMSIEPRSPRMLNETSVATSQPARRQELDDSLDEAGVTGIEQPIQSFAVPQEAHIDPCAERGRDADRAYGRRRGRRARARSAR